MLGEAPRSEEFRRQFDWPDALIHMPFDAPQVGSFLQQLDRERCHAMLIREAKLQALASRIRTEPCDNAYPVCNPQSNATETVRI